MKGHVRKHGKGWAVVIPLSKNPLSGRRRQKWVSGFRNKTAAERARVMLVASLLDGQYVDAPEATTGEYLYEWLRDYVDLNLRPKTQQEYRKIIDKQIVPWIGDVPLRDLRPQHIQQMYTALLERKLSARSVRYAASVLRKALQMALKQQMLIRNPADACTLPKQVPYVYEILEPEDIRNMRDAMEPPFDVPAVVAAWCGLRRGEILGLKWEDFNEDGATLTVRRSLQRLTGKGLHLNPTKTAAGVRTIAIPSSVIGTLVHHRAAQAITAIELGPLYESQDLMFARSDGRPLDPDAFTHAVKRAFVAIGKPRARLHDTRHSHSTHLLRQGVSPRQVSDRLGHSDASLVLRVYAHSTNDEDRKAAERFDEAMQA